MYRTLLLATLILTSGCELIESAKSTIIVAGIVAASPEVQLENHFDVKSETLATVYLGQRSNPTSSEEPEPISGADITLEFAGNKVTLLERVQVQKGFYEANSVENDKLLYAEGQIYSFAADIPGNDAGPFGGFVSSPTRLTPASLTLSPEPQPYMGVPNLYTHAKSADLMVSWTEMNGAYGYVTVVRATAQNPDQPQVVFDSRPKDAQAMLQFILGTPPTSIMIPGDTFNTDAAYAVIVVTADKGDVKTNTFLGSPILAGSGEKVLLAVGNFRP
jgi:hypothetical protein